MDDEDFFREILGTFVESEVVQQLELAIKTEHNLAYVRECHSAFIALLRQVVNEVKAYLSLPKDEIEY